MELRINKNLDIVPETARYVSQTAVISGVPGDRERIVCFVVESALELRMNAMTYQNEIVIGTYSDGEYFNIELTDKGTPYIITANQNAMLKRGLVDKYCLTQLGNNGTRICFSFKLAQAVADEPKEENREEELLDENISFKITSGSDEDINAAIGCIYAHYGNDTGHRNMYKADAFRSLIASGRYMSVLGRNEHGQVLVHGALRKIDSLRSLPRFSTLTLKDFARKHGFSARILGFCEDTAKRNGATGIYAIAGGINDHMQKKCLEAGFTPCGVYFGYIAKGTGDGSDVTDHEGYYCVKVFDKEKVHRLHLPAETADFTAQVLDKTGTKYTLDTHKHGTMLKPSRFSYVIEPSAGHFESYLTEIGSDMESCIENMLSMHELASSRVATVMINACEMSCIGAYDILKENGFEFTGFLPGSRNGDFIMMQRYDKETEDGKAAAAGEFAQMRSSILTFRNK